MLNILDTHSAMLILPALILFEPNICYVPNLEKKVKVVIGEKNMCAVCSWHGKGTLTPASIRDQTKEEGLS